MKITIEIQLEETVPLMRSNRREQGERFALERENERTPYDGSIHKGMQKPLILQNRPMELSDWEKNTSVFFSKRRIVCIEEKIKRSFFLCLRRMGILYLRFVKFSLILVLFWLATKALLCGFSFSDFTVSLIILNYLLYREADLL